MNEIYQFGIQLLQLGIDLMTLVLIGGIFYVIGLAIATMVKNQQPKWQNVVYVLVILGAGIGLLRWYPQQVIGSIRTALEESRPEAQGLRDELQYWLPGPVALGTVVVATAVPPVPPTVMPEFVPPTATAVTPIEMPTSTPQATATAVVPTVAPCVVNVAGMQYPCPPTLVPVQP